mmetsp:Transcript_22751/g.27898  ORF Transcript_22751/g.27898 Transcript_22751/m.27898 type:complete len:667 (+) Transcript_22751:69-2069(+)
MYNSNGELRSQEGERLSAEGIATLRPQSPNDGIHGEDGLSVDDSFGSQCGLSIGDECGASQEGKVDQDHKILISNEVRKAMHGGLTVATSADENMLLTSNGDVEQRGNDSTYMENESLGVWSDIPSPTSSMDSATMLIETPQKKSSFDRQKTIRFSPTNQIHHFSPSPEEFQDNPDSMYYRHPQTIGSRARRFLTVYALPFMYGSSSNVTTLFLLIELTLQYEVTSIVAGAYLASSYICRVFVTSMSRVAPKSSLMVASTMALLGFALIVISQNKILLEDLQLSNEGFTFFAVGSIFANSNETISGMRIFVREQNIDNVKTMGLQLKNHYRIAKIARVLIFGGGGVLHHFYGVKALAALGALMVSLQIVCLIAFYVLDNFREVFDPKDGLWGEDKPRYKKGLDCSIRAAFGRRRLFTSAMSKLNRSLAKYYPSDVPSSALRYLLPLCTFGRTISSIIVWNISALVMNIDYAQSEIVIGGIFSGMMLCDWLVTEICLLEKWKNIMRRKFPSPWDVYIYMIGVVSSLALVAVPIFPMFITGLIIFNIFNSALRTLLTELQGTSNNGCETFYFMIFRRFWTITALFSLPVLHSLHPQIPFVLAIWFAFFTTVTLFFLITCYKKEEEEEVTQRTKVKRNKETNRPSRRPEKNLNYSERIMLSHLIKGKDI